MQAIEKERAEKRKHFLLDKQRNEKEKEEKRKEERKSLKLETGNNIPEVEDLPQNWTRTKKKPAAKLKLKHQKRRKRNLKQLTEVEIRKMQTRAELCAVCFLA